MLAYMCPYYVYMYVSLCLYACMCPIVVAVNVDGGKDVAPSFRKGNRVHMCPHVDKHVSLC